MNFTIGVDIGSTTAKLAIISDGKTIHSRYERHFSQVRETTLKMVEEAKDIIGNEQFSVAITGSAGLGVARATEIPFVQEVYATGELVRRKMKDTDAVVELGGEDAKILFFDKNGQVEERMNGSCAGGTGAFIDQMATLLAVTPTELDLLAQNHQFIYTIASRCGVFAKTDIQPLLNQGAKKEDVAASIFQAVVDQTITGLAQGKKIRGKVLFLGGPLFFFKALRARFIETLSLSEEDAIFPDWGIYAVAMGAATYALENTDNKYTWEELVSLLKSSKDEPTTTLRLPPLFENRHDYDKFIERHTKADVKHFPIENYSGNAYLGIDCGSTTTKLCLIGENSELLYSFYQSNLGNPVSIVRDELQKIYELCSDKIIINASAVTGYGEELIKNAFNLDAGLVETVAHFYAASYFNPEVDFILDIGGQDIKCFKINNGVIDNIILNEACSSGCGSFIETFAKSMGHTAQSFAKEGLFAKKPVDLGSRCTVFMNSSVKQAQKEGATLADISAGLSVSVTKNAIYKVIRAASPKDLGEHIVVQGGTFLNDAILRSFEIEVDTHVIRPSISGLMGAFGAALYSKELNLANSCMSSLDELISFEHKSQTTHCKLCNNHCNLTVNTFKGNRKFISGNRCEKPLGIKGKIDIPNMFNYKMEKILSLQPKVGKHGKIGIPLGLNMFENLPFWHTFFTELGFEVVLSDVSSRDLYRKGQDTIPSDTVCYPAKLMHGHIQSLIDKGVTKIYYPCMPYSFDEGRGDNNYNCPVVAYYPELLSANMEVLKEVMYYQGYVGLHKPKHFATKMFEYLGKDFSLTLKEVKSATKSAYNSYEKWMHDIREEGDRIIAYCKNNNLKSVVLAGRPYHVDPEINHGLDKLVTSFDLAILTEDAVAHKAKSGKKQVLNQWTYHARLYDAAQYAAHHSDTELIQLVSFGCGIDSITGDEVKFILEKSGKIYTQLKIDEINNLSAIKIRIRSLLAAIDLKQSKEKRGS